MPLRDWQYPRLAEVAGQIEGMHEGQLNAAVRFLLADPARADSLCSWYRITAGDDREREIALARGHFGYRLRILKQTLLLGLWSSTEEDDGAQADEAVRCALMLIGLAFETNGYTTSASLAADIPPRAEGRLYEALARLLVKDAGLLAALSRAGVSARASFRGDARFLDAQLGPWPNLSPDDIVPGALMLLGRERVGRRSAPIPVAPPPAVTAVTRKVSLVLIVRASKLGGLPRAGSSIAPARVEEWLGVASYFYAETLPERGDRIPQLDSIEANLTLSDDLPSTDSEQEVYLRLEAVLSGAVSATSRPLLQQALRRPDTGPVQVVRLRRIDMLTSAAWLTPFTIV